jgi:hypothetical protein
MTWYAGAIAKESAHNWQLCKDVGLFGISTSGRQVSVGKIKTGDELVIWQSGKGWIGFAHVVGDSRKPTGKEETPCGGGVYRFGLVFPIQVEFEPEEPVWLPFKDAKQEFTGMPQFAIRKGFSMIADEVGKKVLEKMKNPEPRIIRAR